MLGFGGHFLTKARRYSTTLSALRQARTLHQRAITVDPTPARPYDPADTGEETILVVGHLTYAGTGWHTTGDALLANTAAAQARERHRAGREEVAQLHTATSAALAA